MPENNVSALLSGNYWSTPVLGYFFADSLADYRYMNFFMYGFQAVDGGYQQAARNILEGPTATPSTCSYMTLSSAGAVANISFYSTGSSRSDIAIASSQLLDRSIAYYPDPTFQNVRSGDVWLSSNIGNAQLGTFGYYTIMHDLGHALGLKHGHEQSDTNNPIVLSPDRDSIEFSVMTYRTYIGDSDIVASANDTPQTFMMYDIATLQYLYGANFNTNSTNTVYTWDYSGGAYVNGVQAGNGFGVFMTPLGRWRHRYL